MVWCGLRSRWGNHDDLGGGGSSSGRGEDGSLHGLFEKLCAAVQLRREALHEPKATAGRWRGDTAEGKQKKCFKKGVSPWL